MNRFHPGELHVLKVTGVGVVGLGALYLAASTCVFDVKSGTARLCFTLKWVIRIIETNAK